MRFDTFKEKRELFLQGKLNEDTSVFNFLLDKYEDINESIFGSVLNWLRKNFSPKAQKIESLGKDYYKWLMDEYNASYNNSTKENDLDIFLRSEKVSNDIEDKILEVADDSELYKKLAKGVILKYKIAAKKDFSIKILGKDSRVTRSYTDEYSKTTKRVDRLNKELTREDSKNLVELKQIIQKDSRTEFTAKKIASSILVFFKTRAKEFSLNDMKVEYEKGEKKFLKVRTELANDKGAVYLYCIRTYKSKIKYDTLDADKMKELFIDIQKDIDELKLSNDTTWGLIKLLLLQKNPEDRSKIKKFIEEKVKDMSDEDKTKFSNEIEKKVEAIDDLEDIKEIENLTTTLEKTLDKEENDKETKDDSKEGDKENSKDSKEGDKDSKGEEKDSKEIEKIKKIFDTEKINEKHKIIYAIECFSYILATVKEKNGKKVFANSTRHEGLDTGDITGKNIEIAKTYVKELKTNLNDSIFNDELVKTAAESLASDYVKTIKTYDLTKLADSDFESLTGNRFLVKLFALKAKSGEDTQKPIEDIEILKPVFDTLFN